MATPNQKAQERPISFVLHNTAAGSAVPVKIDLVIRPEDLTRSDVSRTVVNQTLGGAWVDSWGKGLPSVQISGTTGWGSGGRKDGLQEFLHLHATIFERWHKEREEAVRNGFDPDKVKLIFCDELDEFTWVVVPLNFSLRRNKARPLLSQYQINLEWAGDGVSERAAIKDAMEGMANVMGVSKPQGLLDLVKASLGNSLSKIQSFAAAIKGEIGAVLGPVQKTVAELTSLTALALGYANDVIATGMGVVQAVSGPLVEVAANLSRSMANVMNVAMSIMSVPQRLKAEFSRVASAFVNAYCVLRNSMGKQQLLPSYDELYGASTCSSTAGGSSISRFDTSNPFPELMPVASDRVQVTGAAANALGRLARLDVLGQGAALESLQSDARAVLAGVKLK